MSSSKNKIKEFCSVFYFQKELNSILSFISEFCEVPHAYISLIGNNGIIIKAEKDFNFSILPDNLAPLNEKVIAQNKISIVSTARVECQSSKTNTSFFSYAFFAGLPICANESLAVGTLCIMDTKEKKLSPLQLKSLGHAVLQIKSLLELHIQNKELEDLLQKKENQFKLFKYNSNEIFYELSLEGIFTYSSENWTRVVGHDLSEVIGKSYTDFIHPEDIEKCRTFLKNLTLEQKKNEEITYRILHKEGYYVWYSSCVKLVEIGGIQFYVGNCRDINDSVVSQQKVVLQKEFYEKILDQLPTDVAVFDANHNYIYLNLTAIKNDELRKFIIGRDDFEYAEHTGRDPGFAKKRREKFIQALETKEVVEWEDQIQQQDGKIIFHKRKIAPVFRMDRSLEMMIGFGIDITENKKIKKEFLESRQLTKNVIKNAAVGILVQGLQFEILENNKAACDMLGLSEDQLLGKTSFDKQWSVIHLDGTRYTSNEHPVAQAMQQLKPVKNMIMGIHRPLHNDLVWLMVDAIPVFSNSNELLYVVSSFNDITARKEAEDALKISNERFIHVRKATSDALWDWNLISDEMFMGDNCFILFGYQYENNRTIGLECMNLVHRDDRLNCMASIQKAIDSENDRWTGEYRHLKSDGTYAYVKNKAIIIRNDQGKAIRMIGAIQDITNEKKLKDELQQSEERFKGAFHYSSIGMSIADKKRQLIEVNNRLCDILGYTKEELIGSTFSQYTHPEDLEINLVNDNRLISEEIDSYNLEIRYIHKNKSIIWCHLSVSPVKKDEVLYFMSQIMDITERKKIEKENELLIQESYRNKAIQLKEAKNMYRLLADNTIDLVFLQNLDTSFRYVSPSVKKLLGYAPKNLIGKLLQEFIHPDDIEVLLDTNRSLMTGAEEISIKLRCRNIEDQYFWFDFRAILIKKKGIPIGFQCIARDITERIKAEKIIENALIQERELNELRINLVSTISHEFRTPMTTIRTSAEMIAMYLEGQDFKNSIQIEKRVHTITEEIDRIVELMNAVLTISKEDSGKTNFNPVVFDLKKVCMDVVESSYSNQKDKRKVKASFKGKIFNIFADKNLVEYSLFNLLNNAFKYSEGFGDVILNLFDSDNKVILEIVDFGIGIPDKDQSKLFNTFFRASNTDGIQGTGLGLYIVKTFIEKNSGTVQLESRIGKGTKVTLSFPIQNKRKHD